MLLVTLLVAAGCRRTPPPARPPAPAGAPDQNTPAKHNAPEVGTEDSHSGAALATAPPKVVPQAPASGELAQLVPTQRGAVLVWAINNQETKKSDLIGRALDEKGTFVGPAKLLRRTSGPVENLDVDSAGDKVWVGWLTVQKPTEEERLKSEQIRAERAKKESNSAKKRRKQEAASSLGGGERKKYLIAALRTDLRFEQVEPPVTIANFWAAMIDGEGGNLVVGATKDGGAVVLSPGEPARCDVQEDEAKGETQACDTVAATTIGPDAKIADRKQRGHIDPGFFPHAMTQVPDGLVYVDLTSSYLYTGAVFIGTPKVPVAMLNHAFDNVGGFTGAWNGEVLMMLAEKEEAGTVIWVVRPDGKPVTKLGKEESLPKLLGRSVRCVEGRPVLTLKWKGGKVELDPGKPDAARRLTGFMEDPPGAPESGHYVWAGQALVGLVADKDNTQQLKRWSCASDGFKPR